MSVIFQKIIKRSDLVNNPKVLFLFGDNEARVGKGGQAKECRGEENGLGVATKKSPCRFSNAFWSDSDFDRCSAIIDNDLKPAFAHIRKGGVVVCPSDGIGTGLSQLPKEAPLLQQHIRNRIKELVKEGGA